MLTRWQAIPVFHDVLELGPSRLTNRVNVTCLSLVYGSYCRACTLLPRWSQIYSISLCTFLTGSCPVHHGRHRFDTHDRMMPATNINGLTAPTYHLQCTESKVQYRCPSRMLGFQYVALLLCP